MLARQILIWVNASEETMKALEEFMKICANDKKSVALKKAGEKQLKWFKDHPWPGKDIVNPVLKIDEKT